ncbi:MAG: RNA 2',3'-cyclic phosphodiesterase [Acidimicrobiia bacterium]
MTRAFVAVRLPETVLDAVAARLGAVALVGRPTSREQWHLTLQFLGDDADVDAVAGALDRIDATGGPAQVGGAGAFPDARHARVLWLGLAQGNTVVTRLAAAVARHLTALGHEPDARPFRAHLTVARCRMPIDLRSVIESVGNEPVGPTWEIDAVTLYESIRHSTGADYVARATIPLPAGPLPM